VAPAQLAMASGQPPLSESFLMSGMPLTSRRLFTDRSQIPSQVPQDPGGRFLMPVAAVHRASDQHDMGLSVEIHQQAAEGDLGPFAATFASGESLRYTPIVLSRSELVPFDQFRPFEAASTGHPLPTQFQEWTTEGFRETQMPCDPTDPATARWSKFWRGAGGTPSGGLHLNGLKASQHRGKCVAPNGAQDQLWATWVPGQAPYPAVDGPAWEQRTLQFRETGTKGQGVAVMIPMYQELCGGECPVGATAWEEEVRRRGLAWVDVATGKKPASFMGAGSVCGSLISVAETLREVRLKEQRGGLGEVPPAERWVTTLVADGRSRITKGSNPQNLRNLEAMGLYASLDHLYAQGQGGTPSLMEVALGVSCELDDTEAFTSEALKSRPRYRVNGHTVHAHLFERTLRLQADDNGEILEMKMMFLLKEFNGGKLDSQLWFFEGLVKHMAALNPGFDIATALIDAGTIPRPHHMLFADGRGPTSDRLGGQQIVMPLLKIVSELLEDPDAAGSCGAISVGKEWVSDYWLGGMEGIWPTVLLRRLFCAPDMVELAQHFEYTAGNLLDKAAESFFGYIPVLPGAFSCYRYSALTAPAGFTQKGVASCFCAPCAGPPPVDTKGCRPLDTYFRSITDIKSVNPYKANMFLAEDRILCFDLICRQNYRLLYVTGAPAWTDVPSRLPELIKQRRRWINGSFFALLYALLGFFMGFETLRGRWQVAWGSDSTGRPRRLLRFVWDHLVFFLEFLYQIVGAGLAFIMVANMFLGFYLILRGYAEYSDSPTWFLVTLVGKGLYVLLMAAAVIGAFGVKTDERAALCCGIFNCGFRFSLTQKYFHVLAMAFQVLFMLVVFLSYMNLIKAFQSDNASFAGVFDFEFSCDVAQAGTQGQCDSVNNAILGFVVMFGLTFAVSFTQLGLEAWQGRAEGLRALRHFVNQCGLFVLGFYAYMMLLPTYVNILMVYAFSNLHDTSWGTKGLENQAGAADQQASEMREFRTCFVLVWLAINGLLVTFITSGWNDLMKAANVSNSFLTWAEPMGFLEMQCLIGCAMMLFKAFGSVGGMVGRATRGTRRAGLQSLVAKLPARKGLQAV